MDELTTGVDQQAQQMTEPNIISENETNVDAQNQPVANDNGSANVNTSVNAESGSEGQQTPSEGKGYVLATDEAGNRYLKPYSDEKSAENSQSEPQDAAPEQNAGTDVPPDGNGEGLMNVADNIQQGLTANKEPYSVAELSQAIATNTVDESRVPEEYRQEYVRYRIGQAVAAENQRAEMQRQMQLEQQRQLEAQLTPEERQTQTREFLTRVEATARERAAATAGLTKEDLENLDFMDANDEKMQTYKAAIEWHRSEIMQQVQARAAAENTARQQQAAMYQSITSYAAEQRAKEPNFDAIDRLLPTKYKEQGFMGYDQAKQVEAAITAMQNGSITEQQLNVMREYYEAVRKDFYLKRNNLSSTPKAAPKPPKVERPGSGGEVQKKYTPDYNALRNAASPDERVAWMKEYLFGNRS